jgi:hypothetical protein
MMKVTKLHVASHQGANQAPSSGDVFFDDGKNYGWCLSQITEEITFSLALTETRFRHFRSPKRAEAVQCYLDR